MSAKRNTKRNTNAERNGIVAGVGIERNGNADRAGSGMKRERGTSEVADRSEVADCSRDRGMNEVGNNDKDRNENKDGIRDIAENITENVTKNVTENINEKVIENVIEARGVSFRYEGSDGDAIEDANFSVRKGEIVFITGRSGSGKSTLLNLINGIIPEVIEGTVKGELNINGKKDLKIYERSLILGNVFQNPRSQFFTTDTTSELVFQMENYGFPRDEMERRLRTTVQDFGVEKLLNRKIFGVSSGERQMLALLTVFIMNPEVVIFDEPSANLDYGNAMRLKKEILRLKERGKTVIVADHRYFFLNGIVDRVLLLEHNRVLTFETEDAYIRHEYGKRASDLFSFDYPKRKIIPSHEVSVELKNLSYKDLLRNISVTFRRGEATVLVGVNGVGKTTLAKLISRLLKPDGGEIEFSGNAAGNAVGNVAGNGAKGGSEGGERNTAEGGADIAAGNGAVGAARRISGSGYEQALYMMQDADFQLFGASCLKELEITQRDCERNLDALQRLNLGEKKERHPQTLSGGEKQRLQMAIGLVSENRVMILDEPTSGLDRDSMNRVVEMIEILKRDKCVLVISHDYEFIRKCADRVVYIKDAEIGADFYLFDENVEQLNQIYKEMEVYYE